jgi:xanthine dehydrogenase molybdopterin-binding subunit B
MLVTGLQTKVAQAVSHTLGSKLFGEGKYIPLDKIRIEDTDSSVTPNGSFTGGSTGSEGSAEAARRACNTLVERMKPVLVGLKKSEETKVAATPGKTPEQITWEALAAAAKGASIDLSASDQWSASGNSYSRFIHLHFPPSSSI